MENCKDKNIIARQLTIFTEVDKDLGARLEKATGVKAMSGGVAGMTFNGSHNGFGKRKPANGLKEVDSVDFDNGAPVAAAA